MNKVLTLPIREVRKKYAHCELRPTEVCSAAVKLSSALKPLNAYINATSRLAKQQSEDADKRYEERKQLGDLDGIPIAVKDNFCVEGQPTTCASLMLANFVPGYDATVYRRLRENGAVLMGKTNLDQFAMGAGTVDSHYGPTKNVWGSNFMPNYDHTKKIEKDASLRQDDWVIAGDKNNSIVKTKPVPADDKLYLQIIIISLLKISREDQFQFFL